MTIQTQITDTIEQLLYKTSGKNMTRHKMRKDTENSNLHELLTLDRLHVELYQCSAVKSMFEKLLTVVKQNKPLYDRINKIQFAPYICQTSMSASPGTLLGDLTEWDCAEQLLLY